MATPQKRSPARDATRSRAVNFNRPALNSTTAAELEGLAHRLHKLLRDMVAGRDPAEIVANFSGIYPSLYAALAAIMTGEVRA